MRIDERTLDLSAEEGARVVALGLLSAASEAAERLVAGADDEALHDFRVALRALRSALRAFRPWLEARVRRRHERRLEKLAGRSNEARDAEVQLAWLKSRLGALASERRRSGLDLLVERLEARARAAPDPARAGDRYRRAAAKLRRRLRAPERSGRRSGIAVASFGGVLATLVRDQLDALRERMRAVLGPSDEKALHRTRIEGKRLRYLLEPLRGNRRADASEAIARLKRLQDVLGELHDAHVLAAELREALVDAAGARARELHAAIFADRAGAAAAPGRLRAGASAGLLALGRLVCERRDALYAAVEREWRAGGMDALSAEVRAVIAALEARAGRERDGVSTVRRGGPDAAGALVGDGR